MANLVDNVIDDKLFSVLEGPLWNVETALRGVGATSFIGSNFGLGLD
jgi:hypothetical protein